MKTDKEILEQTNKLAMRFYAIRGYEPLSPDFKFYKSKNRAERFYWDMACEAQLVLKGTDVYGNIDWEEIEREEESLNKKND